MYSKTVDGTLTLRVDLDSSVPAYRQIIDELRVLLVSGKLAPGSALPSVRRMAVDLGVHFNTVAEAYRTLAEDGWLDLRHGSRATVLKRDTPLTANAEWVQEFRHRLRALVAEVRAEGASAAKLRFELRALADEIRA